MKRNMNITEEKIFELMKEKITSLLKMRGHDVDLISKSDSFEELGVRSLEVATLVSILDHEYKVDPFSSSKYSVTDIRTLGDVSRIYHNEIQEK